MPTFKPKKYYIKTFGCQANTADSNTMAGMLEALGFEAIPEPKSTKEYDAMMEVFKDCDLFIMNTCSVRQKSEDKVYGMGKILKEAKLKYGKSPYVVISGCMVGSATGERQRIEFSELKKKTSWANLYMNPSQLFDLPNLLKEAGQLGEWAEKKLDMAEIAPKVTEKNHAYVNISYGCDNFCTYCVVPYSRGKEISRTKEEILREIKHLITRGITEITLCGQNVNSWGLSVSEKFHLRMGSSHKLPFVDLLNGILELPEITKLDFISSNPFDFTQDLIDTLKNPKIGNYLHIAVQSGNNEVLKAMNRRHTIEEFIDLYGRIKQVRPDMEIGTDIIVGFPGETEDQFMDTVNLFDKLHFNVAFIAMYSTRKGTYAQKNLVDDVPAVEKKRRHAHLTKVWKKSK